MDTQTIALVVTSVVSIVASMVAAYTTVRKSEVTALKAEIDSLKRMNEAHEKRIAALETDLTDERAAHKTAREERDRAHAVIQRLRLKHAH